jgi:hypothetical protein
VLGGSLIKKSSSVFCFAEKVNSIVKILIYFFLIFTVNNNILSNKKNYIFSFFFIYEHSRHFSCICTSYGLILKLFSRRIVNNPCLRYHCCMFIQLLYFKKMIICLILHKMLEKSKKKRRSKRYYNYKYKYIYSLCFIKYINKIKTLCFFCKKTLF